MSFCRRLHGCPTCGDMSIKLDFIDMLLPSCRPRRRASPAVLEARASSEIENIVTTTDRLFRLAADETAQTDPATKEALRYRSALRDGDDTLSTRPLSANLAVHVCI